MEEQKQQIKANARLVIAQLGPATQIDFGLNRDSVEWVEGFIERQRARLDCDTKLIYGLVNTLGSFLGECVIAAAGGDWQWVEQHETWGVAFANGNRIFPFAKVHKLFLNGLDGGDSILSFYDIAVALIATGAITL